MKQSLFNKKAGQASGFKAYVFKRGESDQPYAKPVVEHLESNKSSSEEGKAEALEDEP